MNTTFTISEVYKTAWDYTKKNLSFLLLSTFVFLVFTFILDEMSKDGGILSIMAIANVFVYIVFYIGLIKTGVLINKGEEPSFDSFKTDWVTFWRMFLSGFLVFIFVALGTILLVIPGIIIATRLSLTSFLVVDRQYSYWTAIKESWKNTKGYGWKIFGLILLGFLVFVVSVIPLGLGVIISIPFLYIVYTIVAMKIMSNIHNEVSKNVTPAPVVKDTSAQMPLITEEELEKKKDEIVKAIEEVSKEKTVSGDVVLDKEEDSLEEKSDYKAV